MEFAGALRQAIQASGLTLERIRHRLGQRGLTVSVATLSYWQRGRSRPRSRVVVAALEEILQVAAGTLTDLLDDPAPSAPSVRGGTGRAGLATGPAGPGDRGRAASDLWPDPDKYAYLVAQLDRSGDHRLERLSIHDVYRLDEARRSWTLSVRTVLRAAGDDIDRVVCVHQTGQAKICTTRDDAAPGTLGGAELERDITEAGSGWDSDGAPWPPEPAAEDAEAPGAAPMRPADPQEPEPVPAPAEPPRPYGVADGEAAIGHEGEYGGDHEEDARAGGAHDAGHLDGGGHTTGHTAGHIAGHGGEHDGADQHGAEILDVRYCRPGRIRAEDGLMAFELVFDRVLAAGDTAVIEYELGPVGDTFAGDGYDRRFAQPVHDYVAIIQFEGGRLPARCYGFTAETSDAPRRRLGELWIGTSGSANLALGNVRRGIVGIEWEWH